MSIHYWKEAPEGRKRTVQRSNVLRPRMNLSMGVSKRHRGIDYKLKDRTLPTRLDLARAHYSQQKKTYWKRRWVWGQFVLKNKWVYGVYEKERS